MGHHNGVQVYHSSRVHTTCTQLSALCKHQEKADHAAPLPSPLLARGNHHHLSSTHCKPTLPHTSPLPPFPCPLIHCDGSQGGTAVTVCTRSASRSATGSSSSTDRQRAPSRGSAHWRCSTWWCTTCTRCTKGGREWMLVFYQVPTLLS